LISELPADERVDLLLMDVDGVLTDGKLYFGTNDFASKSFHVRDGLGIALLAQSGVTTGIVSGRSEEFVVRRAKELAMRFIRVGVEDKAAEVVAIAAECGIPLQRVAFIGDDVNDIPAFAQVGVSIAVHDAHPEAIEAARFVTATRGGHGAVREVADLLRARLRTHDH
jgi:3-deoxy-D-manno-octulosonate 8-phosphate phosphatase (KDO 8-P phosphatase)